MGSTTNEPAKREDADPSKQRFLVELGAIVRETGATPLFVSDKDGTLTLPRRPLADDVGDALLQLLGAGAVVTIISGGEAYRLHEEALSPLAARASAGQLSNLYIIAENGSRVYRIAGTELDLVESFGLREAIGAAHYETLIAIVEEARRTFGIGDDLAKRHIVAEGSQIKLSALGNLADDSARQSFDPTGAKRGEWAGYVRARIVDAGLIDKSGPLVDVIISGTSSINLLPRGVNKGFAIARLAERCGRETRSVVYFGDSFGESGNDACALANVRVAVNFGLDVCDDMIINAVEKGPSGARHYMELARAALTAPG